MAKVSGAKKETKDNKKSGSKKEGKKLSALYNISGGKIERKNKFCPKCGAGTFLGAHKNRSVCGKCQYVDYTAK